MLQSLFIEILITSCIGAALAGILALIRPLTQKHFSSRWHYYMWLVVLAVMMCPIRLNLSERQPSAVYEPTQISAVQTTDTTQRTTDETAYMVSEPQTAVYEPMQSDIIYEESLEVAAEPRFSIILGIVLNSIGILPILWIIVAVLLFATKLISYDAFVLKMKRSSHITECEETKKYTRRKIMVRISKSLSSPLMIGIIKPVLLLPDAFLTDEQLENILKHEMTHFRRHDILYKWFTAFVKCIHWFNPAIYFISRQINIDCEISCDMAVTADMGREEEIGYIDTILALVSRANARSIPLTTGMAGSKKILKKRFLTIRNRINTTKSSRTISRIAAAVTAAAALTASITILSGCNISENNDITTSEPINTDKIYQGNGFSIVLPANAEITENGYKTGENLELLRAQILSVGSIVVQIEEKEYSSYDRDKILENYESWRNLDGERTIEDFHTITDESGREIGRSYALVIGGEVMQYRSEYKYGNDTDESYALVTGDGKTLEKRDKYNKRNSTLIVLGQPMTGEVFDSEANAELIKKYIDSFRLHDVSNPLEDTELTPLRISARIFVNGDFTKEPIMQRDDKYTLEEYGIPQDIVVDSIFNRTNMGAAADEVDVIKTTDTALVTEKLKEHIDKQIDKFKSDPHEHEKLNDAVLVTYGDTVIFAVSENSEAVRRTIADIAARSGLLSANTNSAF